MTRRRWPRTTAPSAADRAESAHASDAVSLNAHVAHTSLRGQLHQVRLVIRLGHALKAAVTAGDRAEIERLGELQRAEQQRLEPWAAELCADYQQMSKERLDALLATGGTPS